MGKKPFLYYNNDLFHVWVSLLTIPKSRKSKHIGFSRKSLLQIAFLQFYIMEWHHGWDSMNGQNENFVRFIYVDMSCRSISSSIPFVVVVILFCRLRPDCVGRRRHNLFYTMVKHPISFKLKRKTPFLKKKKISVNISFV